MGFCAFEASFLPEVNIPVRTSSSSAPTSLAHAMDMAAQGRSGVRFFSPSGDVTHAISHAKLRRVALRMAAVLAAQYSLPRGSRIGLLAQTRVEFIALFFACQYLGVLPCPLPFSLFAGGQDAYTRKLGRLLDAAQVVLLVTPQSIKPIADAAASARRIPVLTYETLGTQSASMAPATGLDALRADEAAYIQFSSGTTAQPTGLLISQTAICANISAIVHDGMRTTARDRALSWLPYYHDMGLVGFVLAPVWARVPVDYLAPTSFARRPALWLTLISSHRHTITYAPGFAYALAAQRLEPGVVLDLSCLRIAGVGGDMVHAATLRQFAQKMRPHGFAFKAFAPSYGLAQATLAVTMTRADSDPLICRLGESGYTQELVSSGAPLPGYVIRIASLPEADEGSACGHCSGEIRVKGPSMAMPMYADTHGVNPLLDAEGYLPTGDLGFMHQGELFVTGRSKDLIIVRGRNIWAQDVEWVLGSADARLRPQQVCAFGTPLEGDEKLVVLLHNSKLDAAARTALRARLLELVHHHFGVSAELCWLAPHQLSTTSSGKLARAEIKKKFLAGALQFTP